MSNAPLCIFVDQVLVTHIHILYIAFVCLKIGFSLHKFLKEKVCRDIDRYSEQPQKLLFYFCPRSICFLSAVRLCVLFLTTFCNSPCERYSSGPAVQTAFSESVVLLYSVERPCKRKLTKYASIYSSLPIKKWMIISLLGISYFLIQISIFFI